MNIYETVQKRTSIRKYKTDSVPIETVLRVVGAARRAPSWANRQCWRFIVVDSHTVKNLVGKASGQDHIAKACEDAPYIIVLCADTADSGAKNGMDYYMFDSGLAMENLMLAAAEEGLSTCVIGWFDEKAVKAVLNVPDKIKVIAFTPLGYGAESPSPRARKKQEDTVFYNIWGKNVGDAAHGVQPDKVKG